MEGVVKSIGQVYGINHLNGSIVIGIGVFLASPTNFLFSAVGGLLGSLVGILFSVGDHDTSVLNEVYDGVWGFNPVIGMQCLIFFVQQPVNCKIVFQEWRLSLASFSPLEGCLSSSPSSMSASSPCSS